ncbi:MULTISPECIES: carbohydrate kinase family protein [Rhizobium]|uniref:Putative nucleoside 2-deoxyribosyltransferase protein n=1 Tax=Rhizobium etli (strain CIAT 652) TaxID=491916 RepID=B3Q232_RHIE6|nr:MULTISPECIES: carbohydrate kinase family protein [Rhizobium]ACE93738.1 putative nucleoside 2-deoxyribosyltransferase protein [Rhizobium etli CIAT 652]UWU38823.1 carbohydrate kinase family protein [Rhizobium leguminosarum bv. phaseoli]ANK94033.1 carbohydrate/purine kinase protein [Rhizobium sp. N6212]ANL00084.1 carbohydrate/purine kinase protein [Rhizobium sp. N621]ANL06213.1 carbohydrate/purine kinase protein [Rhizobium esperanzae]
MFVAGGLYREVCETPSWNREFGSGVRAAAAISKLSPGTKFHTYRSCPGGEAMGYLKGLGVDVVCEQRPTDIVFAYFHPLSNPLIRPAVDHASTPLAVTGDCVLRFGFLEGSAIVNAERAVYDPQGSGTVEPFEANGSKAGELAIVLNEEELLRYSGSSDMKAACDTLLNQRRAGVIVVKCGVRGALVVERERTSNIPPYHSERVFKIGTGDVFSAVFAHTWAEQHMPAVKSAEIASKAVSFYCDADEVPLPPLTTISRFPLTGTSPACVALRGSVETLGRRYSLEEARYCLQSLGMAVEAVDLGDMPIARHDGPRTLLILADGLNPQAVQEMISTPPRAHRIVVLDEEKRLTPWEGIVFKDDFITALYVAAWPVEAQ